MYKVNNKDIKIMWRALLLYYIGYHEFHRIASIFTLSSYLIADFKL